MTRTEEMERKQARNRKEYEARREKRLEQQRKLSREWYWKNRSYYLAKSAATRQRLREEALVSPRTVKPSIESIEESLPYDLRINKLRLREEFLKIPILERPPYDVYLKQKTIEHLKNKIE